MTDDEKYPYAVSPPYGYGWQHDLTKRQGPRGGAWTTTRSEPQWTARFKKEETADWFKARWSNTRPTEL